MYFNSTEAEENKEIDSYNKVETYAMIKSK